jgi:hypothetical protein
MTQDFQSCVHPSGSRRCFDYGFRALSDNTLAVIPVYGVGSAVSVVARGPQPPKSTRLTFEVNVG